MLPSATWQVKRGDAVSEVESGQSRESAFRIPIRRAAALPDTYAPDGSEIRLLLTDNEGATRVSVCEVRLPAGQVSRPVWHRTVEECWYVLAGTGEVWRCPPGPDAMVCPPTRVSASDLLVIPSGWRFQFRACPESELRLLCFTSPPWPGPDEAVAADAGGLGRPTV
jgi:mannose-6-phosphate isomerase-like protein (cupin superfamily)